MSGPDAADVFQKSVEFGWVLEPDALAILAGHGIRVVEHCSSRTLEEAKDCAAWIGYPLVAKVISPAIMHKSEVSGVAVGVRDDQELAGHFARFKKMEGFRGMLVAEMLRGVELFLGAKNDPQFGPVILLGIGGTAVEIYGDIAIGMAPLAGEDVLGMVARLKGRRLLKGFRDLPPVGMDKLTAVVLAFSDLMMDYRGQIDSADINPLICSTDNCVVADARIILPDRK